MRLGLLGPAGADKSGLETAARFLLEDAGVDRAVYLAADGALDEVVAKWAERLVGGDPSENAIWARATQSCLEGDAHTIEKFLAGERARRDLRRLESLPDDVTRAVEMFTGGLAVMIHDKAHLNEEDMLPARILAFGKSKASIVRQVGQRWFLSPGSTAKEGVITLEDSDDGVELTLYDRAGKELRREMLSTARKAKLKVGAG